MVNLTASIVDLTTLDAYRKVGVAVSPA